MRRENGYFTLETTLLMPFILGVIFLVMWLWLFQYDRCLMEQDMAAVVVKSCEKQDVSPNEREAYGRSLASDIYKDKYYLWKSNRFEINSGYTSFSVTGSGEIDFIFPGLNFWNDENKWQAQARQHGEHIKKVELLRTARKIL